MTDARFDVESTEIHDHVGHHEGCPWNCLHCSRGLARRQATAITSIGVDEKAFRKGHGYLTMVNDVERGTVEFVAEGRGRASVVAFYPSRTPDQLADIKAVAMEMRKPYIQSTLEAVALAPSKIVFDSFHVMRQMTEAVDVVRRQENRLLIAEDDDRLKGKKFLWISSKENVDPRRPTARSWLSNVGPGAAGT